MRNLLFLLALACVLLAAGAEQPLPFFVNFSDKSYGGFQPSEDDLQFDFNQETGMFEIVVDYDLKQPDKFIRFYQKDGDEILPRNALVWTRLAMLSNKEYDLEVDEGLTSPLQITAFYGEVTSAQVRISTLPDGTVIHLRQVVDKEFVPEKIYVWGSDNGGFSSRLTATMEPDADNPYLFTTDMEMPTWYFDPNSVMADFAANSFVFSLSTSADPKAGTRFRAHLPYETEDLTLSNIYLAKGETFTTTLQTEIQESTDLSCHAPGLMHLTFDYSTLEFTATMLDPMNRVTLVFDGIDTYVHNKYIDVFCNGEEVPLFVNPQNVWYNETEYSLSVVPKKGYEVSVESLTEDASFELTEDKGVYRVTSSENGLQFLVNIEEDEDTSGIENVTVTEVVTAFNLQGIPVAEGSLSEVTSSLPAGLYIISGRLVRLTR